MKLVLTSAAVFIALASSVNAQPIEYVRVCPIYGSGFFYIPGTERCIKPETGEIRYETANGTVYELSALAQDAEAAQTAANRGLEGAAIALTMPEASVAAGKQFAAAVNVGGFDGKAAVAGSMAYQATDALTLNGGVGLGLQYGTVGAKGGVNFSW
ncbi:YadA C-terminal domain-containing protein [Devosia aurantiaca]|nr:YadA C-terminal domain-containing protein [Devosia aurantiaca]